MKNGILLLALVLGISLHRSSAAAPTDQVPDCPGAPSANNAQVLQWKTSTQNQFTSRGHVQGTIQRIFPDHSGHHHFELALGSSPGDDVEIVFNEGFGTTPPLRSGMSVEACGDYITAYAASGGYPPSPDGALIHWVHRSDNPGRHPSGFLVIDGTVYGQGKGK